MDCPTHSTLQSRKIDSQNNAPLHEIYREFDTMKFDPKKRRKHMGTYEPIFQHMYKNLKNHSEDKDTFDIFSIAKSVMEKEFHEDLEAGKTQIFVKKPFSTQLLQLKDYKAYIRDVEKLKAIHDINELLIKTKYEQLTKKLVIKTNYEQVTKRKENMAKRLKEAEDFIKNQSIEMRALSNNEIQMVTGLPRVKSEKAKMKLFQSIRKYFTGHSDGEVLVLMDFKFIGPKASDLKEPHVVDCFLVNFTKRYIMPIDAKATLNEQSLKKALKRLENSIHFINDWLGGDLSETFDWKILPALYFDRKSANFDGKICQSCHHYIIQGKCIDAQLKNIFSKITPSFTGNHDMTKIEFMKLSLYLLFLVSIEPIVRKNSSKCYNQAKSMKKKLQVWRLFQPMNQQV